MINKILVIDDSKDLRALMSLMFTLEGYQVEEASCGQQALAMLKNEELPNLIFLDYLMEEMDGRQFLSKLEVDLPAVLENIPIIMMTGDKDAVVDETRVSEIVGKPIGIDPLLELAKRYLH